ncbi:MAG: LysM peptidoglycan-binding domain-containing protein [Mariprofundaceae bacterium]|nr:LysM peptidoglycan-binding domain-containing protein [Mariprofundaceae bacterium]
MKLLGLIVSCRKTAMLLALACGITVLAAPGFAAQDQQESQTASRVASTESLPSGSDLRPEIKQPYIVKKGDTLWDIANYFFKDPQKWLNIWEQNLYISNPDLIYPGNEISFAAKQAPKTGGLKIEKMQPQVRIGKAQRIEDAVDTSMIVTALLRQDFIRPEAIDAAGYVLDSPDERINYGANDLVYMQLASPAEEGSIFDVFRSAEPVRDPATGKPAGLLVKHLGQIQITGNNKGISEGIVLRAFEEISRGDRLKPARNIDTRMQPYYSEQPLAGNIMYIRDNAAEAGQNQIVGINLGEMEGVKAGSVLKVLKAGRTVTDKVSGKSITLPEENVGQLIVLVPQQHASIALVSRSTHPINRGDAVRNSDRP